MTDREALKAFMKASINLCSREADLGLALKAQEARIAIRNGLPSPHPEFSYFDKLSPITDDDMDQRRDEIKRLVELRHEAAEERDLALNAIMERPAASAWNAAVKHYKSIKFDLIYDGEVLKQAYDEANDQMAAFFRAVDY